MTLEFCSVRYNERTKNGFDSHTALKGKNVLTRLIAINDWENALLHIDEDHAKKWSPSVGVSESIWSNDTDSGMLPLAYCSRPSGQILPIHQACSKKNVKVEFLEKLIAAYPGSLHMCDSVTMRTPLHLALICGASDTIIFYLLEKYRSAASIQDYQGRVALHYACANGASTAVIQNLLECCPKTVLATDEQEWTPLHIAAVHSQSTEIIDAMLNISPKAILMFTKQGETAITIAEHNKSEAKDVIIARLRNEDTNIKKLPDFQNIIEAYARSFNKFSPTEAKDFV